MTTEKAQQSPGSEAATPLHVVKPAFRWKIGRQIAAWCRFREVSLANWAFQGTTPGTTARFPLFNGIMLADVSRSAAQRLLYLMRERMVEERVLFQNLVRPGMRVVDIGANIGYCMLMFRDLVGPKGHVICIEPSPDNFVELRANYLLNAFPNVALHELAIGKTIEELGVRSGINGGMVAKEAGVAVVRVVPLDDLITERVDFIKIDVDGFEGNVLEGSRRLLERDRPTMVIEMHPHLLPRFGTSCGTIYAFLKAVYPLIEAFETERPNKVPLIRKITDRYGLTDPLLPVADIADLIRRSDAGQHNFTFWLVCRAEAR